jgi:hypothetical protein
MDGTTAFFIFGSLAVGLTFFWVIGSIRKNTAKAAESSAVAAGLTARIGDIKCPKCKEFIKYDAEVCRYCGFDAVQAERGVQTPTDARQSMDVLKVIDERVTQQVKTIRTVMMVSAISIVPSFVLAASRLPGGAILIWLSLIGTVVSVPLYLSQSKKARQAAMDELLG